MLFALEVAKRKLSDYYGKTYHEHGDIYSSAAILSPKFKLAIFDMASWEKEWKLTYRRHFSDLFFTHYADSESLGTDSNQRLIKETTDSLSKVLRHQTMAKMGCSNEPSEVTTYLWEGTSPHANILDYWRAKQYALPWLASMAYDILAVPAAGIGVKRMFNMVQDICHYHCGNLKATSIHGSMILKVFDRI